MPAAPAIISGVASIGGSLIQGQAQKDAAKKAAAAGSGGQEYSARLQSEAARNALNFQKQQWYKAQEQQQPWVAAGTRAVRRLENLTGTTRYMGGPDALAPIQPTVGPGAAGQAPGFEDFQATPGYQWMLEQGELARGRAASAGGRLGSGAYLKDITRYSQGLASQEYDKYLNRKERERAEQLQRQQIAFNQSLAAREAELGPLQSLAGVGQTSVGRLGALGGQVAGQVAQTGLGAAQSIGRAYAGAGAARASGYAAQGAAQTGMIGGIGGGLGTIVGGLSEAGMFGGGTGGAGQVQSPAFSTSAFSGGGAPMSTSQYTLGAQQPDFMIGRY